ncbi:MAG: hypothetical protein AAF726_16640 [Planctomycetota bacterium]
MPEPLRRSLPALVAILCACSGPPRELVEAAQYRNWRRAQPVEPRFDREVERDPETGQRLVDRGYVEVPGGTRLNHGVHRTWYPNGQPASLREFADGDPIGTWWTWWRVSGLLRSAYEYDPDRATPMSWWHANGRPASSGLALLGKREGPWRFWHENGRLKSEGSFVGGRRNGPWVFYDEDGEWTERGDYRADKRVGSWEFRGAMNR